MVDLCPTVAFRDGGLQERDQILVINGVPLEADVSHPQALALLQQPGEQVELLVARERPLRTVSGRVLSPPLPPLFIFKDCRRIDK